ncbi:hypothetical protein OROHE_003752 [Orobanche hederae]
MMNATRFCDTPASPPTDSSFANRSYHNRIAYFDFRNPRFPGRRSHPRSKPYVPYKTQLCLLFQRGKCYYGERCHYSHSLSEIRNPGLKRHFGECFYFSNGEDCPYGEKCQFHHNCDERVQKKNREICAVNISNQIPWRSLSAGGKDYHRKLAFRKTKLCDKWEWLGVCPYGLSCDYAHGKAVIFAELGTHILVFRGSGGGYSGHRVLVVFVFKVNFSEKLQELGLPSQPLRPEIAESGEVASKIAKKLALKGRSYFTNWDIAKISRIYADN